MNQENVFNGDLKANSGEIYQYTKITGYLNANGTTGLFPKLTSVGGYLEAQGTTGLFPKLTSVGGYLEAQGTTGLFPKLTSVGGYLDAREQYPNIKQNDPSAIAKCRAMLISSFAAAGFSFADSILAKIVSQRGPVQRVVICGKTEISYLVTDSEVWSHGKTLIEARDGLLFKIGKRDPSEFKAWTLDKVVSKRDAILAYRTITGACEGGVRTWMEQRKIPDTMTVMDIINMTNGAYGAESFKAFFMQEVANV